MLEPGYEDVLRGTKLLVPEYERIRAGIQGGCEDVCNRVRGISECVSMCT